MNAAAGEPSKTSDFVGVLPRLLQTPEMMWRSVVE
jgi:hypothetical protein